MQITKNKTVSESIRYRGVARPGIRDDYAGVLEIKGDGSKVIAALITANISLFGSYIALPPQAVKEKSSFFGAVQILQNDIIPSTAIKLSIGVSKPTTQIEVTDSGVAISVHDGKFGDT